MEFRRKYITAGVLCILIFILFVIVVPMTGGAYSIDDNSTSAGDPDSGEIEPQLHNATGETVAIIRLDPIDSESPSSAGLRKHAAHTQRPVLNQLERMEAVTVENRLWIINGIVVTIDNSNLDLERIAGIENVTGIHSNPEFEVESTGLPSSHRSGGAGSPLGLSSIQSTEATDTSWALDQINAPEVWSQYGTTGEGVKVAVLDTGIDV